MITSPPFPEVIDSSLLSAWRSCRRKAKLEYFDHYKPRAHSVHLHAGGAYASGMEAARRAYFEEGRSEGDAVAIGLQALLAAYGDFDCPQDSAKSAARMAGALEYHFSAYPLASEKAPPHVMPSGRRAIEFNFTEPIDLRHPESGQPLLFCGRFDQIVDYAGGLWGFDDKTTSALGATWPKQWDLRSQFSAYCWGSARQGLRLAGFLIRGISILKTKYETQEAITYRPQWLVDQWYESMLEDVADMIASWETGRWRPNFDEACTSYGGCMFRQVCLAQEPERWLEVGFERRAWNPVTRVETVL